MMPGTGEFKDASYFFRRARRKIFGFCTTQHTGNPATAVVLGAGVIPCLYLHFFNSK
jgi:hypothetical protein